MNEIRNIIIGLEFRPKGTQICYYDRQEKEPVSISPKLGSNQYLFPTILSKRPGEDVWHVGIEAEYFSTYHGEILIDSLYDICCAEENILLDGKETAPAVLLAHYLLEVLKLSGASDPVRQLGALMVVTEELNGPMVRNLQKAWEIAGLTRAHCYMQDLEESFYYFVMHQKREYFSRKVAWFTFQGEEVSFASLSLNNRTRPVMAEIEKGKKIQLPKEPQQKDVAFYELIIESFGAEPYSSIFMVGEGFHKDWAVRSIPLLCKNQRKVFYGNNLFVWGACYAAKEKSEDHSLKGYLYTGNALVRVNVGMEMIIQGTNAYYPVIEAGTNWYETEKDFEILLDDIDHLVFLVNQMHTESKTRYCMQLPGLPKRPARATRLHVHLEYESSNLCVIRVTDLGFGEMYPSSGKSWEEKISW